MKWLFSSLFYLMQRHVWLFSWSDEKTLMKWLFSSSVLSVVKTLMKWLFSSSVLSDVKTLMKWLFSSSVLSDEKTLMSDCLALLFYLM